LRAIFLALSILGFAFLLEFEIMKIVFASNNAHKVREIQQIVGDAHQIVTLAEIGILDDIPEPFETLEENAMAKASFVFERTGLCTFADDTGLEVSALGGAPGVYSARYAGEAKDPLANMAKLLHELHGNPQRNAQFRTVIAWLAPGEAQYFEGVVEGVILNAATGTGGFGYDPIFAPEGRPESFAELGAEEKNKISHRGRAVQKFVDFLRARK
jgi:XTP/dITP diphosphohydrolase